VLNESDIKFFAYYISQRWTFKSKDLTNCISSVTGLDDGLFCDVVVLLSVCLSYCRTIVVCYVLLALCLLVMNFIEIILMTAKFQQC
jgi:putative flippase GtrA